MSTVAVTNGLYLVEGIQLRERKFTPRWFGRFVIWLFFHRLDTSTQIRISGVSSGGVKP